MSDLMQRAAELLRWVNENVVLRDDMEARVTQWLHSYWKSQDSEADRASSAEQPASSGAGNAGRRRYADQRSENDATETPPKLSSGSGASGSRDGGERPAPSPGLHDYEASKGASAPGMLPWTCWCGAPLWCHANHEDRQPEASKGRRLRDDAELFEKVGEILGGKSLADIEPNTRFEICKDVAAALDAIEAHLSSTTQAPPHPPEPPLSGSKPPSPAPAASPEVPRKLYQYYIAHGCWGTLPSRANVTEEANGSLTLRDSNGAVTCFRSGDWRVAILPPSQPKPGDL